MDKKIYNILLVEDNQIDIKITLRFLHKTYSNIEIFTTENGQEALDFLHHEGNFTDTESFPRPDLILLDLHMPVLDGLSFINIFKKDDALNDIPVVVFSADEKKPDVKFGSEIKGYVVKDFDGENLIKEINKIIK